MKLFQAKIENPESGDNVAVAPVKRAPTLYFIIVAKLIKGILALLFAVGVYKLHDKNLPELFQHFVKFLHFDPERRFFHELAVKIREITPANLSWVLLGTLIYSLFALLEGFGLIFRISWIGYLAIGESAFFIPVEIYELVQHISHGATARQYAVVLMVLGFNVLIVWYLFKNRKRLFHHHGHVP